MKRILLFLCFGFCISSLAAGEEIKTENIEKSMASPEKLEYGGYKIERVCKMNRFVTCNYTVSKDGKKLVTFPAELAGQETGAMFGEGKIEHTDFLKTGLLKLTGTPLETKDLAFKGFEPELVLMTFSGGAHCCWDYKIYSLFPEFKEIFAVEKWATGYGIAIADLDKDGAQELIQTSLVYDYGFDRPHVDSAFPLVVFKYNAKFKQYLPANREFTEYLLQELKKIPLTPVDNEKDPAYSPLIMNVITLLYLGRDSEAWEKFDKYFKLKNKEALRKEILRIISKDPAYIFLSSSKK